MDISTDDLLLELAKIKLSKENLPQSLLDWELLPIVVHPGDDKQKPFNVEIGEAVEYLVRMKGKKDINDCGVVVVFARRQSATYMILHPASVVERGSRAKPRNFVRVLSSSLTCAVRFDRLQQSFGIPCPMGEWSVDGCYLADENDENNVPLGSKRKGKAFEREKSKSPQRQRQSSSTSKKNEPKPQHHLSLRPGTCSVNSLTRMGEPCLDDRSGSGLRRQGVSAATGTSLNAQSLTRYTNTGRRQLTSELSPVRRSSEREKTLDHNSGFAASNSLLQAEGSSLVAAEVIENLPVQDEGPATNLDAISREVDHTPGALDNLPQLMTTVNAESQVRETLYKNAATQTEGLQLTIPEIVSWLQSSNSDTARGLLAV